MRRGLKLTATREAFRERVAKSDDWQTIIVEELFQGDAGQPLKCLIGMSDEEIYDLGHQLLCEAEEHIPMRCPD